MKEYKTIEVSEYEKMLKEISTTNHIDNDNYDLLIYGGGGRSRKFFSELNSNPKYEVLWTGWSGPKWIKFLSFIPGQAGLVRIVEQASFYDLYNEFAAFSVSEVIYVRKELTKELTEQVKNKTWRMNFESFIEQEPIAFVLISEADEAILDNGKEKLLYDYEFGDGLNQSLKNILTRKNHS